MSPTTRARLYETGAAIFSVLVVWGVVTADDAAQMLEAADKALGAALLILARRNVVAGPKSERPEYEYPDFGDEQEG